MCVCDSNGSVMFNIANCRCLSVTNFVYTFVYRKISHETEISRSVNLLILTVPRKTLNGQKIESMPGIWGGVVENSRNITAVIKLGEKMQINQGKIGPFCSYS